MNAHETERNIEIKIKICKKLINRFENFIKTIDISHYDVSSRSLCECNLTKEKIKLELLKKEYPEYFI